MVKNIQVKVCGLTREADVDLAVSLGADYYGFILYPKSPRGISLERAKELIPRVPQGRSVAVDVETGAEEMEKYVDAGFGQFQIHTGLQVGLSTLATWAGLAGENRLWLAPRIGPEDAFPEAVLAFTNTILVDTYSDSQHGGTGQTGDWSRYEIWKTSYPETDFILAGGLAPGNVAEAIARTGTDHVDVNSGVEIRPGIKDPVKLESFFDRVRGR